MLLTALTVGLITKVMSQTYLIGDFHQHTTYTDGSFSIAYMMQQNHKFGLDWWANSEHGGISVRDAAQSGLDIPNKKLQFWDEKLPLAILGSQKESYGHRVMWRWQVLRDYSFKEILKARTLYLNKTIIQSYEMNIPGHEHGSMGIINNQFNTIPDCNPLAEFEFCFDQNDTDTEGGAAQGWTKSSLKGHAKAIESLQWLKNRYPLSSYLVLAHPERKPQNERGYSIASIRDFNNTAPDICFGFESVPGHHREAKRGGYDSQSVGGGTYGGSGVFSAQVGGLWDALLTEGRRFWLFSNSDYHSEKGEFYPGEYQKNYTYTQGRSAQHILDGLRSGNNWVVTGDLIDSLIFNVKETESHQTAQMGSTLNVANGKTILITIHARDPQGNNHNTYSNYRTPELDHIDLIQGELRHLITPDTETYNTDTVNTTAVIARFDNKGGNEDAAGLISKKWKKSKDGWVEMNFEIKNVRKGMYFRLRGTNHAVATTGETDAYGNPCIDPEGQNTAAKAFADLWFYSNPLFVSAQ